jgi:hypothetical protein
MQEAQSAAYIELPPAAPGARQHWKGKIMSGALKSVFGGGNLLGGLLNIASAFFPPLQLVNSALNLLTQVAGQATKMAADTLSREFGMPKFVANMVKDGIDNFLGTQQRDTTPEVDEYVRCQCGDEMNSLRQQWSQQIAERAAEIVAAKASAKSGAGGKSEAVDGNSADELQQSMAKMRQQGLEESDQQRTKAKNGGGRKGSAGSWLEAIAQAMGEVLGQKASKMVELSDKIAKTAGKEGKQAAAANARATSEMQATSQMFNLMQSGFTNAIKTMGEGLTQMARKGG